MSEALNQSQKEAIEYTGGPLLIVAGPGSGKTKVLTHKATHLLEKLDPQEILMTTFTVKASEEMRQRIEANTEKDVSSMFIGTIHSLCEDIIKEHGRDDVYTEFEVLDDFKRYLFLKRNMKKLGLDLQEIKKLKKVMRDNELIQLISSFYDTITSNIMDREELKSEILNWDDREIVSSLINYNKKEDEEIDVEEIKRIIKSLIDSYDTYLSLLKSQKFIDFANLEAFAWQIIENEPNVKNELQEKFKYVLIDEFQDINPIQWNILKKIVGERKDVACVGDRNQSIYGFRGSNPNIFDHFKEEFSPKIIELDINYRSKKQIVDFANRFLEENGRKVLDLKNSRSENCKIHKIVGEKESETARNILNHIKLLKEKNIIKSYGEVAILFRSLRSHGEEFFKILDEEMPEVPYVVYGGISFLNNPEIESILYLLAYVYDIKEKKEVKNVSKIEGFFDLFNKNLVPEKTGDDFKELNWEFFSKEEDLIEKGISKENAQKIVKLNDLKEKIKEKSNYNLQNAFYEILGIIDVINFAEENNKSKILYNLGSFSEMLEDFASVYNGNDANLFFKVLLGTPENLNLKKDNDSVDTVDNKSLFFMNIHQAKGLEFPIVIVPSLINKRVPNKNKNKSLLNIPQKFYAYTPYDPNKEEQNLFYVAVTRAKDSLLLSYFNHYESGMNCRPSEFIKNLEKGMDHMKLSKIEEIKVTSINDGSEDIKVVDYSAISTFMDCPERFKINYLYGFKAAEIFQQKVGRIYHNAIAKLNQELNQHNKIDDNKVEKILNESWVDLGKNNDTYIFKIRKGLKKYRDFMNKEMKKVKGIETPVSVVKNNVRIRGRSDLVYENKEGEIVLMDYKARKLKAIEETHADIQLKFYADSLKKDGEKIDKAVAYPIEEENLNINEAEFQVNDDEKTYDLLNNFVDCINKNKFKGSQKGVAFCKECPYRFMCKYYKKGE